jgi:hypothetical protein
MSERGVAPAAMTLLAGTDSAGGRCVLDQQTCPGNSHEDCLTIFWIVGSWLPIDVLLQLRLPPPEPVMFLRLLGTAYLGLLAGYWIGLRQARNGQHPTATVGAGIVSNGGAAVCLLYFGAVERSWSSWGGIATSIMWGSGRDLWNSLNLLMGRRNVEE